MASQPHPQLHTTRLRVSGYELHALVSPGPHGARPPLVLVHGLGMSSRYLRPLAESLSRDFCVSVPDLPGFGHSESQRHVLTIAELADTVIAWLDATQLDTAALVGNSLGCQIIAEAAVRHPRRVSHAVLVGPSMDPHARTAAQQIRRLLRIAFREPLALSGIAAVDFLHCGPRRLWRTFQYGLAHPMTDRLRRMQCPTLVIRGERDLLATPAWCDEVAGLLPRGDLVTIPKAAHAAHYSDPERVAAVVREYLSPGGSFSAGAPRRYTGIAGAVSAC